MTISPDAARPLVELKPEHTFFVGIDSDGCVFDSMEIKHKECFCPNTIKHWNLQPVSKYARETAEFVNLYSKWRGSNRWPALIQVLDLLRERAEVIARRVEIPAADRVREFIASGLPLSDKGLETYKTAHPDPELETAWNWNRGVNDAIADMVYGLPPFPFVRETLEKLSAQADIVVVSQTPGAALEREWKEHDIARYARVIAGQEMGTKTQHLQLATTNKYLADHVLMIGDAPGDMQAAKANKALYFPINPGHEDKSWERLYKEGLSRFLAGTYAGEYENSLVVEFEKLLPQVPPWNS
jgi:phosphoglycolate phosphatase-like HAD superfamily hydrolase